MHLKNYTRINVKGKTVLFPKGYYCYVGSALNGLEERIKRHKSKVKKKFWHIDYFLEKAKIVKVKVIKTNEKKECWLSEKIKSLKGRTVMNKFGSTDCKCETHLHFFPSNPSKMLDRVFK